MDPEKIESEIYVIVQGSARWHRAQKKSVLDKILVWDQKWLNIRNRKNRDLAIETRYSDVQAYVNYRARDYSLLKYVKSFENPYTGFAVSSETAYQNYSQNASLLK